MKREAKGKRSKVKGERIKNLKKLILDTSYWLLVKDKNLKP